MNSRRSSTYDPLVARRQPHWLTVSDLAGTILEIEPIEAGTDLRACLAGAMERFAREGWSIEDDGRFGSFFCYRDGARRLVHIQAANPELPLIGPSWHSSCPGCGE